MADYQKLFPSRFVRSVDMDGKDVTLTIAKIFSEEIDDKLKAIVAFRETKKQLVLNRTNAESLKLMWGPETDEWLEKRVTLYPAIMRDPFGDGEITAIRVRGSPDITKAATATVQRGRKTIKVSVAPTGGKRATRAAPPDVEAPPAQALPKSNGKHKAAITDVRMGEDEESALKREAAEYERSMVEADQASNPL